MALLDEVEELLASLLRNDDGDDAQAETNAEKLVQSLEEMRRKLLQQSESERDPRWLLVNCHVVEQIVWRRVVARPRNGNASCLVEAPERDRASVFVLENAVMSAFHTLKRMDRGGDDAMCEKDGVTAMDIGDAGFGYGQHGQASGAATSWRLVRSAYSSVFACVLSLFGAADADASNPVLSVAAGIMSRLGLLLSVCWLTTDRASSLPRAIDMLSIVVECCGKYRDTQRHAKWSLFLLGMLHFVEKRDCEQALGYFRNAAMLETSSVTGADESDGVFHYWFAVALYKNGSIGEATNHLQWCIRCNYAPVSSLNLSAFFHVSANDVHASALELQRALDIDFLESVSMFNYAVLLGSMRNFGAQQQMLEYYQEAVHPQGNLALEKKRTRSGAPRLKETSSKSSSIFSEPLVAALFAPNDSQVTREMTSSQLAYAALENGDWQHSKQYFEELLAADSIASETKVCKTWAVHTNLHARGTNHLMDTLFPLLPQNNLHSLALEKCDRLISSMNASDVDEADYLLVYLYKADALLSLERINECHQYLTQIVEPKISSLVRKRKQRQALTASSEITACHTQLLNNLAVVTACESGIDAAISILRDGVQRYPNAISLKFNLVLLLWRKEQKEAACSIWFETRGWSLHMDTSDMGDDRKAMEMVTSAEDAAIRASTRARSQCCDHVQRGNASEGNDEDSDSISKQQLLYLDALVLNHWGKIRSSRSIEHSVQYVQYLDSLATSAKKS